MKRAINRDFARLWTGDAVSSLGSSMSSLIFPIVGYALTGSAAEAGLASTAALLGSVLARLPAGALVDRWPRGRVLVVADVAAAAAFASLAIAAAAHALTLVHLVVVALFSGVAEAFLAPAFSASVRTVVPTEELPTAYAQLQVRDHAASLIGPPAGGALYSLSRGLPFGVDALSYLIGALAVSRVRTPLPAPQRTGSTFGQDLREGLVFVWRHAALRAVLLWGGAFNFAATFAFVTVTLRLVRAGVHPAAIGGVEAAAAVAGLLGALIAPLLLRRLPTGVVTFTTGVVIAVEMVPVAWTTNAVLVAALLAGGMLLIPANNAGISAFMVSIVPDRLQARVNAAGGFVSNAASPAAPALAGLTLGALGGRTTTLIAAGLLAFSLAPLVASPATRHLGRPETWADA